MSERQDVRNKKNVERTIDLLNKLKEEHNVLKEELDQLENKPLSVQGEAMKKEIKKKKLVTKDKIVEMTNSLSG